MRFLRQVAGVLTVACLAPAAWAQPPGSARRSSAKAPQVVVVRDVSGSPVEGAQVTVSGPVGAEATTDAQGTASIPLGPGSYRFRFEHEGFITLERDVTIRPGRPAEIAVALNGAPAPPEPPPPATPPAAPVEPPVAAAGPPVNVSIPEFLEKSFVGREPMKESILSCMPDATARLLQLREPLTAHTHAEVDEILYVVAGDGALRIGNEVIAVTPGSMSAIPRGTRHSIERRGRNPLIVLSTLAGASCPTAAATAAHTR
jgi:mannose-6-phosphate isomerase-like protein (cupin superfamily)